MSSSSFAARWLFRALLGAAFGRKGWKWFWRTVPIYKPRPGALRVGQFNKILRDHYFGPLMEQLTGETVLNIQRDMNRQAFGAPVKPYTYVPPTRIEKLKRKMKYKFKRMKPVLTTQGKLDDMERY